MWISIIIYMFANAFCSAQVTNNDAQTVTETVQINQEVEWDAARPSVTLSIRDGRSDTGSKPQNEVSSRPLFYSNEWKPILMSNVPNTDEGMNNGNFSKDDNRNNYQFTPTFLRRPDSDLNRTSSRRFMKLPNVLRYPFAPMPMRPIDMAPTNPMFFYPRQLNYFPNENYGEPGIKNALNNSTTPVMTTTNAATEETNFKNMQENIEPLPFPLTPKLLARVNPFSNPFSPMYRNRNSAVFYPRFFPFPIVPETNFNPFNLYNGKRGSEIIGNVSPKLDVSKTDATPYSRDIQEPEAAFVNETPSDSSSTFFPPEPLPLTVADLPFEVLPPSIYSPIIPGLPALSNPISGLINPPEETTFYDPLLHPTVPASRPSLEKSQGVLLLRDTIKPESKLPPGIDDNIEKSVFEDKSSEVKIPYEFGFDMNDGQGTDQHRREVSDVSGVVRGSYGYRDMFGVYRFVNYIADKEGFRAFIKSNEPGVAGSGSAGVVVMAEEPPIQVIAEGENKLGAIDASTDLIAEGSE